MKYSTYSSIVLRRETLDQKYARLLLFTREKGLVDVKARGLQKSTSKLAPKLEPGFESSIELYEVAPGQLIVTSADPVAPLVFLEENFETMKIRFLLLEFLAKILPKEVAEEALFVLYQKARVLFAYSEKPEHVYCILITKILAELGYLREVRHCIECGKHLGKESFIHIHSYETSFLCSTCPTTHGAARTEVNVVRTIAYYLEQDIVDALQLTLEKELLQKVLQVLHGFITTTLGRPLESFAL